MKDPSSYFEMVEKTWLSVEPFGSGGLFCAPYGFSQETWAIYIVK